jgi:hypothetical protein
MQPQQITPKDLGARNESRLVFEVLEFSLKEAEALEFLFADKLLLDRSFLFFGLDQAKELPEEKVTVLLRAVAGPAFHRG